MPLWKNVMIFIVGHSGKGGMPISRTFLILQLLLALLTRYLHNELLCRGIVAL